MLSPRWRKVLRDLWLHKSRTGLAVAAICIGIIGAGSVLNAWSLLRRATRMEFDASHPASAVLRTDSIDAALLARVRALPAIASAQARRSVTASVRTPNGAHTAHLIAADDFTSNEIGIVKPAAGAWPPSGSAVVVEHSSLDFAGVALGDSITLAVGDGPPRAVGVAGIARDVGLAPGWMEHVVYIFVAPALLDQLGAGSRMNDLEILVRDHDADRAAILRIARDVQHVVEQTGRTVHDTRVPIPGRHIHAGQIDSLLYTQGAFALLALLLSGVLVVNLISALLTGQVREIGVMKAIGARADQIASMYLGLALALGLIASVISIPLAAVLGRMYATFTAEILNFDVSGFTIPTWSFALQVAVGVLLPVVAAAFPVARGCRISVSEALRDFGITGQGDTRPGMLLRRVSGLSRPVLLSLRNAFRRRQRLVLTLATLSLGGAVYLGALNLRESVIGGVDLLFSGQHYDMTFRFTEPHRSDSVMSVVSAVSGVGAAEGWSGASAALSADGSPGPSFSVVGLPVPTRMLTVAIESGRWMTPGALNEIVVNRTLLANEPTMGLGQKVSLVIAGKTAMWTVVGIAEPSPSATAFAALDAVTKATGRPGVTSVVIASAVSGTASKLELTRRAREVLANNGFEVAAAVSVAQQRVVIEDHLLMVASFLGNMSLLMLGVGGLGLASTMSLAVLERTREIGVLRAIGASHSSILAMIQIEGLVIALLSWIIAIPLSLPMSVALTIAFGKVMLKLPVHLLPNGAGVAQWLAVVVVLSLVACAWPAIRATRVTTAAALAFE
ncbi:MAG: ABC transporter permease [Gemmatimonadota bacterium]